VRRLFAVTVVVALIVVIARYPRQIWSHLTHWKGAPKRRIPYTRPGPGAVRLAIAGDVGHPGKGVNATGAAVAALGASAPYAALVLLGDHAYPRGDPKRLPRTVFGPFGAVLAQGTPLLAVLGNHDVLDGHGDAQLDALGQRGRWWAREFGPLLLVGLDSNPPVAPEQLDFLEAALARSRAHWKVIALHHPPYSAGYQGSHLPTRELFEPIFRRHGVDLVLSAHDHDYQRSVPIGGVTYIVTGGAARARFSGTAPFTAASFRVRHYVDISASPDQLIVRAVDHDGLVVDEVVLAPCASQSVPASSLQGDDQVPGIEAPAGSRPG
jgi:hypothetical protein